MAAVLPRHGERLLVQCCFSAVKSNSLVHRAPTTTLRRSNLMARHIVACGSGEGVCLSFLIYINARNVSTSSVSERNSAVDRVLRILPRSSDPASCIKGRLHLSVNSGSGCSFPCMYVLSRIEFHWNDR